MLNYHSFQEAQTRKFCGVYRADAEDYSKWLTIFELLPGKIARVSVTLREEQVKWPIKAVSEWAINYTWQEYCQPELREVSSEQIDHFFHRERTRRKINRRLSFAHNLIRHSGHESNGKGIKLESLCFMPTHSMCLEFRGQLLILTDLITQNGTTVWAKAHTQLPSPFWARHPH